MSAELHHLPARLDRMQRMALVVGVARFSTRTFTRFSS
jgi:hypothetical protein